MSDLERPRQPQTIGEVRQRLAKMGDPWTVDPQLADDEPLRDPPRGGQEVEEVPEESRLKAIEPSADLRELLASQPPSNPALRERWAAEGLIDEDASG